MISTLEFMWADILSDQGFALETRRTFDNGFSIGAFFTRTNVSKEDFGEGSFDMASILRFPSTSSRHLILALATALLFVPLRGIWQAPRGFAVSFGGPDEPCGQMHCNDRKVRWFLMQGSVISKENVR